jgi:UDP-N-acetylmuramoylalanine--D-glutamate ligase
MCRRAGLRTIVAGNIGLPVLDALADADEHGFPDVFVLETSSFQLETVNSLYLDAAVVLNVTEDHLDRYAHFSDYAAAKARIFGNARIKIVNRDDPVTRGMVAHGAWTFGLKQPAGEFEWGLRESLGTTWLARGPQPLMARERLPLVGTHNAANALAALAVATALDLPLDPLIDALENFKGLPHRVERVAEINGVTYYDDSKGTNVGATVAALQGFDQPVVLIAGGDGKGQDFSPLNDVVAVRARAVVLIGRDARLIESAICNSRIDAHHAATMDDAVRLAARLAIPGDAVLLSPACASLDMFRNYAHRAEAFCAAVHALPSAKEGRDVV